MGLSGAGQWETHRRCDGLVDEADGLPNHCSGSGAGELHWRQTWGSKVNPLQAPVFVFNMQ